MDIPRSFEQYNTYFMFQQDPQVKSDYVWIPADARAEVCTECGNCEELCPQQLPIQELPREVAATFATD